eukprot:Nitzschia sp. Nitz4//scaffold123_size70294//41234//42096//NITZ4_005930-RA/size70294-augustus-gene-0.61-mRNA-1//1//CDS//3329534491//290//frame0
MSGSAKAAAFRGIAQARRSCRRFLPDRTIPEATLRDTLESTLRSPSSFNLQPIQIVLVQDQAIKEQLAENAMLGPGNQYRVRDASALAVLLADLEPTKRIQRISRLEKGSRHPEYYSTLPMVPSFLIGEGHLATLIKNVATTALSEIQPMPDVEPVQAWGYKNAGFVAQSFCFAAESHDLATCIMEGFDSRRAAEILAVPDRYSIPLMVATGYDYDGPEDVPRTNRLSLNEIVFADSFGEPWEPAELPLEEEEKKETS